jgi:trk system potassium uptake protein TrkA
MFVLVVGGGKIGSHLTSLLVMEGHQVRVIDQRADVLERLHQQLASENVLTGDGTDPKLLEKAGIKEADVLAAVTGEDEANLVITTLGRFEFHVPRVIARVNNPKNAWLFTEDMGVDVALNQAEILAKLILEEMSLGDMMTLLKLRKGEYSLVEEKVHPDSVASGSAIRALDLPADCTLVAIIRKGELIVPHGDTLLQPADEILAIVRQSQLSQLAAILGKSAPHVHA